MYLKSLVVTGKFEIIGSDMLRLEVATAAGSVRMRILRQGRNKVEMLMAWHLNCIERYATKNGDWNEVAEVKMECQVSAIVVYMENVERICRTYNSLLLSSKFEQR